MRSWHASSPVRMSAPRRKDSCNGSALCLVTVSPSAGQGTVVVVVVVDVDVVDVVEDDDVVGGMVVVVVGVTDRSVIDGVPLLELVHAASRSTAGTNQPLVMPT